METTEPADRRVDISACMEAVSHYDANAHLERGDPDAYQKPVYVPRWEHWWVSLRKNSIRLLGWGCINLIWIAGVLFVANIVRNYYEYQMAGPPLKPGEQLPAPGISAPLPAEWAGSNIVIYIMLVFLALGGYNFGSFLLEEAQDIKPGIPIIASDTGHLPAVDTLVRASAEPIQAQKAVLLRAGMMPTHSAQLVRPATCGEGQHEEQLLRASVGEE